MMSRSVSVGSLILWLTITSEATAQQQLDPTPCRAAACGLVVDWRGPTPSTPDRRYGSPATFETHLRSRLREAGYQFATATLDVEGAVNIQVLPELARAMCDATPGTNTDYRCQTIGVVNVEIRNLGDDSEIEDRLRVRGNCGADELMGIERMAEYLSALLDYELHARENRDRPRARC